MTTKNQEQEAIELSPIEFERYQEMATQELINLQQKVDPESANTTALYPYGATFAMAAAFFSLKLSSVTPIAFTNGVNLTFLGEGGGGIVGGGLYAGAGTFSVDPATLPSKEVKFAISGSPSSVSIVWTYNNRPIGFFIGNGLSPFAGSGGGTGRFTRL